MRCGNRKDFNGNCWTGDEGPTLGELKDGDEVRSGSRIQWEKRLVKLRKLCRYGEEEPETSVLDR